MYQSRAGLVTLLKDILEQRDQPPEKGRSLGTYMKKPGFILVPDLSSSGC